MILPRERLPSILSRLLAVALLTGGAAGARADVSDVRAMPRGGGQGAATVGIEGPCELGACFRLGGEYWWKGDFRVALTVPWRYVADPSEVDLGALSLELGGRFATDARRVQWIGFEIGYSAPTGTATREGDVDRLTVSPAYFGDGMTTIWADGAFWYGRGGQFVQVSVGVLQHLNEVDVTADGQQGLPTRLRLGFSGGAVVGVDWLFEAGARVFAGIAPSADFLLFAANDANARGTAYHLFAQMSWKRGRVGASARLLAPILETGGQNDAFPEETRVLLLLDLAGKIYF